MAEALLRQALRGKSDITVESAGLGALVGFPASEFSAELMHERGIDISAHSARQIDADMISSADLILVMESRHKKVIDELDATARGKVNRLGEWQDKEIADPYHQPRAAYAAALKDIEAAVAEWAKRIKA
jgi:low molecular weight protein-tyrosine phosphatase